MNPADQHQVKANFLANGTGSSLSPPVPESIIYSYRIRD